MNLVPRRGLTLLGADSPDAAALAPLARSRVATFGLADGFSDRFGNLVFRCSPVDNSPFKT